MCLIASAVPASCGPVFYKIMAGAEVMIGVGTNLKESLPAENVSEHLKTPQKNPEREKSQVAEERAVTTEEKEKVAPKGALSESPGKNKGGGTPKKNVFSGPRHSPKKNPWTRNTSSEGGKESVKEAAGGGAAATAGKEAIMEGKGIEIPKGEVGWLCWCVCHLW